MIQHTMCTACIGLVLYTIGEAVFIAKAPNRGDAGAERIALRTILVTHSRFYLTLFGGVATLDGFPLVLKHLVKRLYLPLCHISRVEHSSQYATGHLSVCAFFLHIIAWGEERGVKRNASIGIFLILQIVVGTLVVEVTQEGIVVSAEVLWIDLIRIAFVRINAKSLINAVPIGVNTIGGINRQCVGVIGHVSTCLMSLNGERKCHCYNCWH